MTAVPPAEDRIGLQLCRSGFICRLHEGRLLISAICLGLLPASIWRGGRARPAEALNDMFEAARART